MGYLHYGSHHSYSFDDLTLTHLRMVITTKLLRQESFVFTWADGDAQHSIWLHPNAQLAFEFTTTTTPNLDREWLETLMRKANSPGGLALVDR